MSAAYMVVNPPNSVRGSLRDSLEVFQSDYKVESQRIKAQEKQNRFMSTWQGMEPSYPDETDTFRPPYNPLKLGATIPDFQLTTTKGDFSFHDFLNGKLFPGDEAKPWTVFFSHPADYTPVCTTEIGACHSLNARFASQGTKLIGLSCDSLVNHAGWTRDILHREQSTDTSLAFPIIADTTREIVTELGMLDPDEASSSGVAMPARALVILHGTTVKLTILYPATTGRNFEEVFRILTSLQLTAGQGLATPANWTQGDRLIVTPKVSTEDAKAKYTGFEIEKMASGKPYLRSIDCPGHETAVKTTKPASLPGMFVAEPPSGPPELFVVEPPETLPNEIVRTKYETGDQPWMKYLTQS